MDQWISWGVNIATTLMIGIVGFFIKNTMNRITSDLERQSQRIDALETKLNATIQQMPFDYTLREDFLRAVNGLDNKLDRVLERLASLNSAKEKD